MASIRHIRRTAAGKLYYTPWPSRTAGAPGITAPPSISGTVAPGQTVTAVSGTYTGSPAPTLRRREWTLLNSAGAIADQQVGNSYSIPIGAPTGKLRLREIMSGVGALQAVGVVEASITAVTGLPVFTSNPTISGSAVVGQTLTRVRGTATGSPAPTITDQWLRDGTPISGATGATYTTVTADIGKAITFRNKAENSVSIAAGLTITAVSSGITITSNPATAAVITAGPTITYTAASTKFALSSITVAGNPTPDVTYLWHTASSATATLVARDQGATLTPTEWVPNPDRYPRGTYFALQATASNGIGTPDVKMSARVMFPAQEGFTTAAATTGNAPRGSTLTLSGAWHGSPSEVEYQWYRAPSTGDPIRLSTTASTRKTGPDDEGNTVKGRIRIKYASGAEFFSPSATTYTTGILVTAPSTITYPAISGMGATTTTASILKWNPASSHYDFDASATGYVPKGSGVYNDNWCSALHIIGYEAWRGNTAAQGRLVEWINRWTSPTTCPGFAGGYSIQHGCDFMENVAWGRRTPAVWDALSTLTKNRCEAMAKLALWTIGVWRETADSSQYKTRLGTTNSTTADGNSNPNIAGAPSRLWYAAAWFLGGIDAALEYLEDNDLDDLIATMAPITTAKPANLDLANPYLIWGQSYSGAPTNAQVQSRARSRQSRRGVALNDPLAQLCKEIEMACNKPAVRGLNDGAGVNDSDYLNGSSNASTVPKSLRDRYPGHTKQGRMFLDPATVSATRWNAIKDKIGAYQEFDARDIKSGSSGPRSSISYAFKCNPHVFGAIMMHIAAGNVDPSAKALQDLRDKLFVAKEFMWFCSTEACGYDGVAHIGTGDNGGNSDNVEPGNAADRETFAITNVLSFNDAVMAIIDAA